MRKLVLIVWMSLLLTTSLSGCVIAPVTSSPVDPGPFPAMSEDYLGLLNQVQPPELRLKIKQEAAKHEVEVQAWGKKAVMR